MIEGNTTNDILYFLDKCYENRTIQDEVFQSKNELDSLLFQLEKKIMQEKQDKELKHFFISLQSKIGEHIENIKKKYFEYGVNTNYGE